MQKTITFLMFVGEQCGKAEEAIKLYTSLFKNSKVKSIERFNTGDAQGKEGTVKHALFTIDGLEYMAIDSSLEHKFSFTPSISIYVKCENENEIKTLFDKLSANGQVFIPLNKYPFSEKFGWLADKYGVSWQLNLTID
jgi:predicted 3-demethylubiquinone-9 3-methyltransferase (glyoxalase superfamily)